MTSFRKAFEKIERALEAKGEDGATSCDLTVMFRGDPDVKDRAGTILHKLIKAGLAEREIIDGKTYGHTVYRYYYKTTKTDLRDRKILG